MRDATDEMVSRCVMDSLINHKRPSWIRRKLMAVYYNLFY
jgi:hypothetical protein